MERDVCQDCIVCCVYSVQIIACFSAFSIECHKKRQKKSLQHSHTITQKKKKARSVLSMLSGVEKCFIQAARCKLFLCDVNKQ